MQSPSKQLRSQQRAESNRRIQAVEIRQALNKIAHADPQKSDYFVGPGDRDHDLILFGENYGDNWLAVISLPELADSIHELPDAKMVAA